MRLIVDGHTLPVKNLDTARLRDLAELQEQTGWKLSELRDKTRGIPADPDDPEGSPGRPVNDAVNAAVLVFLSMRAAGMDTTWDQAQDFTLADIAIVRDPGDIARAQEDEASDPPQSSGDSSPDDDARNEEWPPPAE